MWKLMKSSLLAALLCALPATLTAQLPVPVVLEARVGWGSPMGDFADEGVATPASGFAFAVGGRVDVIEHVGVFVGYEQVRFGCDGCEVLDLDDEIVLSGLEAGLQLGVPFPLAIADPWLRGALLYQTLAFSGDGERLASDPGVGIGIAAGVDFAVRSGVAVSPSVGFRSVPAHFAFERLADRTADVSALTVQLGVSYRF